jgi:hypothetical protein
MDDALPVVEGDGDSKYAQEGTCAHALAEIKLARHFGLISNHEADLKLRKWEREWQAVLLVDPDRLPEMHRHTDAFVIFISKIVKEMPGAIVALEQRLFTGIPGCWGTGDVVISTSKRVRIVDLKYGAGVFVPVEDNPQTRLYGAGALEAMDHSGKCAAQTASIFEEPWLDDDDPRLLSPRQMAEYLEKIPMLKKWLGDFEAQALHTAYSLGKKIPGWKVVRSGGQRKWTDEEAAIATLLENGFTPQDVLNTKIKGLGDLEKILGKKRFAELLEQFLKKSDGKPSLTTDDDNRPSIDPSSEAANTFALITEEEDLL